MCIMKNLLTVLLFATTMVASFADEGPRKLTPFRPGEVCVGGEIGQRLEVTVAKMVRQTNIEDTFVRHFRTRKVEPDEPGGFAGYGMYLDALVKAAAHGIGGEETVTFKNRLLQEIPQLISADGRFSMYASEDGNWDSHEVSYLIQALARDYQWFGNTNSLAVARRLANTFIARDMMVTIGTEVAFVLMAELTGENSYWRFLEEKCRMDDDIEAYNRTSHHLGTRHVYTWLARAHGQLCYYGLIQRMDAATNSARYTAAADEALARTRGPHFSISGSMTGAPGWGELWDATQAGIGKWGETCASAYLMRLCAKMTELRGDARCGDVFERVMYNAFFSAQSPDGLKYRYWTPFNETPDWFDRDTFCCPNNYKREIFEIPDNVFYRSADGLVVNLFAPAVLTSKAFRARIVTDYPIDGRVTLDVTMPKDAKMLWIRVPAWCGQVTINGQSAHRGWHRVTGDFSGGRCIEVKMEMPVRVIKGERAQEGRVAILRGPCVYALNAEANKFKGGVCEGYDLDMRKPLIWDATTNAVVVTLVSPGPNPAPCTARLTRYCDPERSRTYFDPIAVHDVEADELKNPSK